MKLYFYCHWCFRPIQLLSHWSTWQGRTFSIFVCSLGAFNVTAYSVVCAVKVERHAVIYSLLRCFEMVYDGLTKERFCFFPTIDSIASAGTFLLLPSYPFSHYDHHHNRLTQLYNCLAKASPVIRYIVFFIVLQCFILFPIWRGCQLPRALGRMIVQRRREHSLAHKWAHPVAIRCLFYIYTYTHHTYTHHTVSGNHNGTLQARQCLS